MKSGHMFLGAAALLLLGACTEPGATGGGTSAPGALAEVPEGVAAIAAPHQDLTTVRIEPSDGCYWYLWNGPVEATYLPLRTREGRPICTRAPEPVAASG